MQPGGGCTDDAKLQHNSSLHTDCQVKVYHSSYARCRQVRKNSTLLARSTHLRPVLTSVRTKLFLHAPLLIRSLLNVTTRDVLPSHLTDRTTSLWTACDIWSSTDIGLMTPLRQHITSTWPVEVAATPNAMQLAEASAVCCVCGPGKELAVSSLLLRSADCLQLHVS